MTRRALLIGASGAQLRGVEANLELMREVLGARGFEFEERPGPTRNAILGALRRLVDTAAADDIIVVYFCGHGGLARFDGEIAGLGPINRIWRYLVPVDELHSHTRDQFHGILAADLGHVLGRELAPRCANVTMILESCYAGGMVAQDDLAKSGATVDIKRFSVPTWLRGPQPWTERRSGDEGSEVVIVAATAEVRRAYESPRPPFHGYFTRALADQLRRYEGRAVTWGRLIDEVERDVLFARNMSDQRPLVIGPRGRVVFGRQTLDVSREYRVMAGPKGRLHVFAGRLHGFNDGDRFELLDDEGGSFGVGVLRDTGPTRALLEIDLQGSEPGSNRVSVLHSRVDPTPVRLLGGSPVLAGLCAAIHDSPWLRVASADEHAFAEVRVDQGRLCITGDSVARWPTPREPQVDLAVEGDAVSFAVLADLEALARASLFDAYCRTLPPPPSEVEFWLSVVRAEGRCMLPAQGGVVHLDEPVDAGMRNNASLTETKYVNVLSLGIDGHLTWLNDNNTGGFLPPRRGRGGIGPRAAFELAVRGPEAPEYGGAVVRDDERKRRSPRPPVGRFGV